MTWKKIDFRNFVWLFKMLNQYNHEISIIIHITGWNIFKIQYFEIQIWNSEYEELIKKNSIWFPYPMNINSETHKKICAMWYFINPFVNCDIPYSRRIIFETPKSIRDLSYWKLVCEFHLVRFCIILRVYWTGPRPLLNQNIRCWNNTQPTRSQYPHLRIYK